MMNSSNYEAQKDEIELLKNILFDQLNIVAEEPNYHIEIACKPDIIDEPKLDFNLIIKFTDNYPDEEAIIEIIDNSNLLASSRIKMFLDKTHEYMKENLSMPMVYQIYEMLKVIFYFLLIFLFYLF